MTVLEPTTFYKVPGGPPEPVEFKPLPGKIVGAGELPLSLEAPCIRNSDKPTPEQE